MADEEKTRRRRGEEGEGKKSFETLEADKSELVLQLQAERQRHREWRESRRINDALSGVMIHSAYMASIMSVCPEGSLCRSQPWVTNFLLFAIAIAFTSAWTAYLMFQYKICQRLVDVLKDIAVGFLMVAMGTALFSFGYFYVTRKG